MLVMIGGVAIAASGCIASSSVVHLTSYKDPYFPESYDVTLSTCAFDEGPTGDLEVVGHVDDARVADMPLGQYLHVHVYWKPRPGRTFVNSSTANAVLRYLVVAENGAALYSGTGFAYLRKRKHDQPLRLELESGRLGLEWRDGELPDFLGKASITAEMRAADDPATAAAILREMELLSNR